MLGHFTTLCMKGLKNVTHNRCRGKKRKEVACSNAEAESRTENEVVEFTRKELHCCSCLRVNSTTSFSVLLSVLISVLPTVLLCLDQGKIKIELERDTRNKGLGNKRM